MRTLLAIDLDGTLLRTDLSISEFSIKAIHSAIETGVDVTLATGRTFPSAVMYAKQLGLTTPIIAYNGAMIKDHAHSKVIVHHTINQEIAENVVVQAEKRRLYVKAYVDDVLVTAEMDSQTEQFAQNHCLSVNTVGSLSEGLDGNPTMIVVMSTATKISNFKQELLMDSLPVNGLSSCDRSVDIVAANVTKASGLACLASILDIDIKNTVAIGNAENDIAMVEWAGLGVAVGNASEDLKNSADLVLSLTNDEDCIADFIYRYLLR